MSVSFLAKSTKMIRNFVVLFEKKKLKIENCTEERQCKVSLAGEYHRNFSPVEILSLVSEGLYFVRDTRCDTYGGEEENCPIPVTILSYVPSSDMEACKLKVFRAAKLVLSYKLGI